jgi:hypothetical protein
MSFLLRNRTRLKMLVVIPIEEPDRLVSFILRNRTGLKMLVVIPIEEPDRVEDACCHSY